MGAAGAVNAVFFYFFAGLAVISSALMVTRKNVIHGAVFLITALLATAGIFLQLEAEFLFAVQVMLYAGGIMVLFIFAIMLVSLDVNLRQAQFNRQAWVAGLIALVLAFEFLAAFRGGRDAFELPVMAGAALHPNTERMSEALFGPYMLPFEIASILLLAAMIGAVVMAKRRV
jgi:NADH-quinone oxidoreductase subunit J